MPIYEYRCDECNKQFEKIIISSAGQEKITCPECGTEKVKKIISASSYRLNSGGGSMPLGSGVGGCSSGSGFS